MKYPHINIDRKHSQEQELNVVALETKHQGDYERSRLESKFCQNYQDNLRTSFEDGKYDGELNLEPEPYQWFNPVYRTGYLAGITARFDELFAA